MHRRQLALLAVIAAALAAVLAPEPAGARLKAGIGDQKASTFSDPLFLRLHVRRTRLVVPWNAIDKPSERAAVDEWMRAARRRHLEILVAFNLSSEMACPARPCSSPSVSSYRRAVTRFNRRYRRYGVRIYQPWNESNSRTQPTTGRRGAKRVAQYYEVLVRMCGRRCTVTGADIQDIGQFTRYARDFIRYTRHKPRIMGFHNYTDTNRFRYTNTAKFIRAVGRARVWLTETGGVFSFTQQDGTVSLAPSESRAARSMSHMYRIARRYRSRIDRLYIYQWSAAPSDRFDAGIVYPDGSARKSYSVVRKYRAYFR
jgi:hypothetical protein